MNSIFDSKQFRTALGSFTTGVTIVTTRGADGKDVGLTANSFNSVSLDPPMVLWSLGSSSSSFRAFMNTEYFAVHILASTQEDLSNRFAKKGADRFSGLEVGRGIGGIPLLDGCSARFECRVAGRYGSGDHVIIVGEVLSFDSFQRPPLVFHGGKYGLLMDRVDGNAEQGARIGENWLGFLLRRAYHQLVWPLRNDIKNCGLDSVHYSILSILAMGDGRLVEELLYLLDIVGLRVGEDRIQELVDRDLVSVRDNSGARCVYFTEHGRRYAVELMISEKTAEDSATRGLDYYEVALLKALLRRVIQNTEQDLPSPWRREKIWLENNIWSSSL